MFTKRIKPNDTFYVIQDNSLKSEWKYFASPEERAEYYEDFYGDDISTAEENGIILEEVHNDTDYTATLLTEHAETIESLYRENAELQRQLDALKARTSN